MKHTCRAYAASVLTTCILGAAAATVLLAPGAVAEISVRTDRTGQYVRTQMIPAGDYTNPRIWTVRSRGIHFRALNPRGDLRGDLWPTIVESSQAPHHPWAVWSGFNGEGYSLVWARWTERGWSDTEGVANVPGSDFDPDLAFDASGRPYVVWWARGADGRGDVYLSVFLINRWMQPVRLTRSAVDARYPSVEILDDGTVSVRYLTPRGTITNTLSIMLPVTITDDINPQGHVESRAVSFKAYKP
jgi:hypothetical protein